MTAKIPDVQSAGRGTRLNEQYIVAGAADAAPGLLDRERIVAGAGFNRWLVPPAALAIHLCIGMAYGLSVFWLPLTRLIGGAKSLSCPGMTTAAGADRPPPATGASPTSPGCSSLAS